jgi:hypothetical protein
MCASLQTVRPCPPARHCWRATAGAASTATLAAHTRAARVCADALALEGARAAGPPAPASPVLVRAAGARSAPLCTPRSWTWPAAVGVRLEFGVCGGMPPRVRRHSEWSWGGSARLAKGRRRPLQMWAVRLWELAHSWRARCGFLPGAEWQLEGSRAPAAPHRVMQTRRRPAKGAARTIA